MRKTSDWFVTKQTWCELCWKLVDHPCVMVCGAIRDASECASLNSLPHDAASGLPIRSKTVVSRDADMNLHKNEAIIPLYLLHQYAPGYAPAPMEKTFTRD